VSHSKEREEKICLNCGAALYGFFCHQCGQDNIEPKQSVWHLVNHFFSDITHFDGKFFSTSKLLITKPGFLSREFINGRRASYLNPIRMYVFTSAFFFLVFFNMYGVDKIVTKDEKANNKGKHKTSLFKLKENALKNADSKEDSEAIEKAFAAAPAGLTANADTVKKTVTKKSQKQNDLDFDSFDYTSVAQYDSAEQKKPPAERNGWFMRMITLKAISLKTKYGEDKEGFMRDLLEHFMHTFPSLLFVTLPLYALILKLLYVRRKQFYYVDHGIFLLHLYIFTFLVLVVSFTLTKINDNYDSGWLGLLNFLLIASGVYYAFRAMYKFYGQSKWKTFFKFILLNFIAFISIVLLFSLFFVFFRFPNLNSAYASIRPL
jgi:hypothetical protein